MKKLIFFFSMLILLPGVLLSQSVGINADGSDPDNSAILDVQSTTKGMLIPRMTEVQRLAITAPATGLMVYQTNNTSGYYFYDGTWKMIGTSSADYWLQSGSNIYFSSGNVGIGTSVPNLFSWSPIERVLSIQSTVTHGYGILEVAGNDISGSGGAILAMGSGTTMFSEIRSEKTGSNGGNIQLWTKPDGGPIETRLFIKSDGNIGIGTSDPAGYRVNVAGSLNAQEIRVNGTVLVPGTGSNWTVNGSNIYRSSGNVGIGTSNPNSNFQVNGNWILGTSNNFPFIGTTGWLTSTGGNLIEGGGNGWANHFSNYGGGDIARFGISAGMGLEPDIKVVVKNTGNLGISTSSPITKLQIGNPYADVGTNWPSTAKQGLLIGEDTDNAYFGLVDEGGNADRAAIIFGDDPEDYFRIMYNNSSSSFTELIRVNGNGNVGIGTTSPGGKLGLNNSNTWIDADANNLIFHDNTIGNKNLKELYTWVYNGSNLYYSSGNVGINTNNPGAKFQVNDGAIMPDLGNDATSGIYFPENPGGGGGDAAWIRYYSRSGDDASLEIGTANDGADNISLMPSGRVGLGTLDPGGFLGIKNSNTWIDVDGSNNLIFHDANSGTRNLSQLINWNYNGTKIYYSAGNVGVGTTNPGKLFTVENGSIRPASGNSEDAGIYFPTDIGGGTGDAAWIRYYIRSGEDASLEIGTSNDGSDNISLMPSGGVGIGTFTPGGILGIKDANTWIDRDGSNNLIFHDNVSGTRTLAQLAPWTFNGTSIYYNSGNIGIGTNNPGTKRLRVVGDIEVQASTWNSGDEARLYLGPDNNIWVAHKRDAGLAFETANGYSIIFRDGGGENMRINGDGNVGIGTTSPSDNLDVRGNSLDNGATIRIGNSDASNFIKLFGGRQNDPNPFIQWKSGTPLRFSTDDSGWSEKMRISSNGNVGIGNTDPSTKLDINDNTVRVRNSSSPASNADGYTGEIRWDSNFIYVCTSGDGPGGGTDTWKRATLTGGY